MFDMDIYVCVFISWILMSAIGYEKAYPGARQIPGYAFSFGWCFILISMVATAVASAGWGKYSFFGFLLCIVPILLLGDFMPGYRIYEDEVNDAETSHNEKRPLENVHTEKEVISTSS